MKTQTLAVLLFITVSIPCQLFAQGEAAVPFLLIHPSVEANGWGNVGATTISDNPIAVIANPAQLGLFSLDNYFAVSTYSPKSEWLPQFGLSDLKYGAWAMSAGFNLSKDLDWPIPIGIGIGYSRIDLDLGKLERTNSSGQSLGTFDAFENSNQFSVGLGADYYIKFGVGLSFKNIHSKLSPIAIGTGSGEVSIASMDFGVLIQAPVVEILKKSGMENLEIVPELEPLLNLNFGFSLNNLGSKGIVYLDPQQPDPLPRNATIGINAELGLVTKINETDWKVFSITIAREAEDLLVTRKSGGSYGFKSGFGDISLFKHVIGGKLGDDERPNLHKGWQMNFGEVVFVRGGSFTESPNFGNRNYTTSGYGLRLSGILKLMGMLSSGNDVLMFISNHFDLRYDHASYTSTGPLGATKFTSLALMVK